MPVIFGLKCVNKVKGFLVFLCLMVFTLCQNIFAQDSCLYIPVKATYLSKPLILNDTVYSVMNSSRIKFESFKFYISGVVLINHSMPVWIENESFHLIDFEESDSNALCLNLPEEIDFDAIQFNLGIDSITNVSGAMGGDLDPTNGMYWTWQNGYINFKLEGTSDLCKNPKSEFQFHLGGYIAPFNAIQKIKLNVFNPTNFNITFDVEQFIKQTDLENLNHIMSPNATAVELSQLAAKCFSIR